MLRPAILVINLVILASISIRSLGADSVESCPPDRAWLSSSGSERLCLPFRTVGQLGISLFFRKELFFNTILQIDPTSTYAKHSLQDWTLHSSTCTGSALPSQLDEQSGRLSFHIDPDEYGEIAVTPRLYLNYGHHGSGCLVVDDRYRLFFYDPVEDRNRTTFVNLDPQVSFAQLAARTEQAMDGHIQVRWLADEARFQLLIPHWGPALRCAAFGAFAQRDDDTTCQLLEPPVQSLHPLMRIPALLLSRVRNGLYFDIVGTEPMAVCGERFIEDETIGPLAASRSNTWDVFGFEFGGFDVVHCGL